jgi:hypothetical protein
VKNDSKRYGWIFRYWRQKKPNLYKTVMKGLAFDEMIEKSEQNLNELKELKEKFEVKK